MSAAVDPAYRHYPKRAEFRGLVEAGGAALKLYHLTTADSAYPPDAGAPRPTFCVWELGIVAHESAAWGRYLASPRDDTARSRWVDDIFEGAV